jgi:hypothetical protein
MKDNLMVLADAQAITAAGNGTGYGAMEHAFNLGDARDFANGIDELTCVITIKTQFTTTNNDDSIQFDCISAATAYTQATGATTIGSQESLTKHGTSSRFLALDLTPGTQIELKLSPITAKRILGTYLPEGQGVAPTQWVCGSFNVRTVLLALIAPTGGTFDCEVTTERVRGQKYYDQARSVG